MSAAWYRARSELLRGWRGTLLLALLVGIVGGAVLTTAAGARRSSTAYDRFRQETLSSDLDVAFDGPPTQDMDDAAAMVRALPQVAAVGRTDFPFVVPAGSGAYPYLDFLAALYPEGFETREVDRPRIQQGRAPRSERADEVAITDTFARESGLEVGDQAEFESYAPPQLAQLFESGDAGPPSGPRLTFVVVGVVSAPFFLSESSGDFVPRMFLSPAFGEAHGDAVATYPGGFAVRLHDGGAEVEEVTEALRTMFADATSLEITPSAEVDRKIKSGVDVIVVALGIFAVVAALAGAAAVAQALTRHFAAQASSEQVLAALGMTRFERIASQAVTAIPVAVTGAALAAVLAVLLSPLMPIGVARRAEPRRGVAVDGPVLVLGVIGVAATVAVLAVVAAGVVTRRARPGGDRRVPRPSRSMLGLRRTNLSPPVTTGIGMAVEPRGGSAWAVRSAHLGAALGIIGLVAVLVVVASADELADSPHRYGSPFDALVSGFSGDVLAEGADIVLDDPRAARVGLGLGGLGRVGGDEVNTYAVRSLKGDLGLTLLDGHQPTGGAEVVLGRSTLESAGVRIGDELEIEGAAGVMRATVVGVGVFPVTDERSSPGRGVLLREADFERISAPEETNADLIVDWQDGVDTALANQELAEVTGAEVFAPRLPSDVNNLREVRAIPQALAAFLALLAGLAVVHALVSTLRMRRQDLAVLRTLGFESRQLRSTVAWQATTIAVIGFVGGVPLGLVTGRAAWGELASGIGVVDDPVAPVLAIAAVVVGAVVVLNAAALLPSRSAGKVAAASVLRSGA